MIPLIVQYLLQVKLSHSVSDTLHPPNGPWPNVKVMRIECPYHILYESIQSAPWVRVLSTSLSSFSKSIQGVATIALSSCISLKSQHESINKCQSPLKCLRLWTAYRELQRWRGANKGGTIYWSCGLLGCQYHLINVVKVDLKRLLWDCIFESAVGTSVTIQSVHLLPSRFEARKTQLNAVDLVEG